MVRKEFFWMIYVYSGTDCGMVSGREVGRAGGMSGLIHLDRLMCILVQLMKYVYENTDWEVDRCR